MREHTPQLRFSDHNKNIYDKSPGLCGTLPGFQGISCRLQISRKTPGISTHVSQKFSFYFICLYLLFPSDTCCWKLIKPENYTQQEFWTYWWDSSWLTTNCSEPYKFIHEAGSISTKTVWVLPAFYFRSDYGMALARSGYSHKFCFLVCWTDDYFA